MYSASSSLGDHSSRSTAYPIEHLKSASESGAALVHPIDDPQKAHLPRCFKQRELEARKTPFAWICSQRYEEKKIFGKNPSSSSGCEQPKRMPLHGASIPVPLQFTAANNRQSQPQQSTQNRRTPGLLATHSQLLGSYSDTCQYSKSTPFLPQKNDP